MKGFVLVVTLCLFKIPEDCNTLGAWSLWSGWSKCGCDRNQTRNRQCQHSQTTGSTVDCIGNGIDVKHCDPDSSQQCPGIYKTFYSMNHDIYCAHYPSN
ncbi:Sema5bp [Mactra antiquata]